MKNFISNVKQYWRERPFVWGDGNPLAKVPLPVCGRVTVLGPHPDDPESVAITCRLLMQSGCDIWYAIASLSPAGVEDDYVTTCSGDSISLNKIKGQIRQEEQMLAAGMFGLPINRLAFLGMEEGPTIDSQENRIKIRNHLTSLAPDIVILPIGKDQNQTHAWIYKVFRQCAADLTGAIKKPIIALYNEDPKTIEIRKDLFVLFDDRQAEWKSTLLRLHDSQQQRNMHCREIGFDERILHMNHLNWLELCEVSPIAGSSAKFAEVFEIELLP